MSPQIPHVLCLMIDGFEEIELITPVDLLRRAGIKVTIAGVTQLTATGRSDIRVAAEALLNDVAPQDFTMLLLPGGPGVSALRREGRAAQLAAQFCQSDRWVAAICAAPLILKDAGLLKNRRYTAHPATADELPENQGTRLVVDGKLITSRGAGTAVEFGLTLIATLRDPAMAEEVAQAIQCEPAAIAEAKAAVN